MVYRKYIPGEEESIVELLERGFGGWPAFDLRCSSVDHWSWKYVDVPLGEGFVITALSGSDVVGALHAYPVRIKVNNQIFFCTYAADNVVHPDYRERGISNRMYEEIIDLKNGSDVAFDYFVTSTPYLIKSWSRRFYTFPFTISNLVWIGDIDLQLREMPVRHPSLVKLGFLTSKTINRYRKKKNKSPKDDGVAIEVAEEFGEWADVLWIDISRDYDFIVERSRRYLNWRYCDKRAGDIVVKQLKREDEVLGFSVYGINSQNPEYPVGYILDLIVPSGEESYAGLLIEDSIKYFKERGINLVNCLMPRGHVYTDILKEHGFLDSRVVLKLFLRLNQERTYLSDLIVQCSPDRVHFTYGDIDSMPSRIPSYV